jgi:hypothetical protein
MRMSGDIRLFGEGGLHRSKGGRRGLGLHGILQSFLMHEW